jgi:D-glucosaminate-6-phosphate ammonia-lyase
MAVLIRIGLLCGLWVCALQAYAAALVEEPRSASGTWALRVETAMGVGTPTLLLNQDGSTLSGTYRGRFGEGPVKGTLTGDAIDFSTRISGPMGATDLRYTGRVSGDTMSGSLRLGKRDGGHFSGERQP